MCEPGGSKEKSEINFETLYNFAKLKPTSDSDELAKSIEKIVAFFSALDAITDLPDEEMLYPTSKRLDLDLPFEPASVDRNQLLKNVPKVSGPFIQSPLVIEETE